MSAKKRRLQRGVLATAALAFALPLLGVAPASAAATCWGEGTDGTYATASCSGVGYARVNVTCNAVWPFTPWTDYGGWYYVNGGGNIVNAHEYCAASITVWVQYG